VTRGLVPDLGVRTPIGRTLPALYHEDEFVQRWCEGLDEVLAPTPSTLDNLWAYLDPRLAPEDFVEWLAGWMGVELDQTWPLERRRELVARAAEVYHGRGTAASLAALVELYVGVRPTIVEGGAAAWSITPGSDLPGRPDGEIVVQLEAPQGGVDAARLDRLVRANKPAHLAHRIEVQAAVAPKKAKAPAPPPPPPPAPPAAAPPAAAPPAPPAASPPAPPAAAPPAPPAAPPVPPAPPPAPPENH
jgi:phage tail-like protein